MNFFKQSIFAITSLAMMTACSSEEPAPVIPGAQGDVYATLTLSLPQGRSATDDWDGNDNSTDGYENGQDRENKVGSVLVVLASKADNGSFAYVTSNLAAAYSSSNTSNTRPTYNVQFESKELVAHAGEEIYVFAYCNPTTKLIEAANDGFTGGFADAQGVITDQDIWNDNAFLMANASLTSQTLPSQTLLEETYNTPQNPFNLGTVEVSRLAARFDFKQTTIDGQTTANRYPIYNLNNAEEGVDKDLLGYVQLDGMALFNQAINYYYLPRTSADGTMTNAVLCGRETPSNYVVSPGFTEKAATTLDVNWIQNNYMFNGQVALGDSYAMDFTSFTYSPMNASLGEDDDENWGPDMSAADKTGYNIWRYTTENTIPGTVANQRNGITTGVVFKGHIEAVEGTALATAMNGTNIIYAYDGVLYGDLEMVKAFAVANPSHPLTDAFKAAYKITGATQEEINAAIEAIDTDLTASAEGIALYRPDANGQYTVYYPYYNRHNDNGLNAIMGPMEFSVVRNNVYKLQVTNILEFGHPGNPGDDPDPEDPDDPDETPKTYFRVSVKVLPWVVRVNNIIL